MEKEFTKVEKKKLIDTLDIAKSAVDIDRLDKEAIGKTTVKARAYLGTSQENLTNNTWTKITLDTESYDVGNNFASNKFTAPRTGYYLVCATLQWVGASLTADKRYYVGIYVDGSATSAVAAHASFAGALGGSVSDVLYIEKDSYIELYANQSSGGNTVDVAAGETITYMAVHLLSV